MPEWPTRSATAGKMEIIYIMTDKATQEDLFIHRKMKACGLVIFYVAKIGVSTVEKHTINIFLV